MADTIIDETQAELNGQKLVIVSGTPANGQFTAWVSGIAVQGLTAAQVTALLDAFGGDSGAGGVKGLVPAPAAGDAAAEKFLKASGGWAVPAGTSKIAQIVNTQTGAVATGSTVIPIDNSIPQITEGTEFMTLAVTPNGATNKLRIDIVFMGACATANRNLTVALFKDADADALAAVTSFNATASAMRPIVFSHYMTAGGTGAITFRVRAGVETSGTVTFNGSAGSQFLGGVFASGITITEYVP